MHNDAYDTIQRIIKKCNLKVTSNFSFDKSVFCLLWIIVSEKLIFVYKKYIIFLKKTRKKHLRKKKEFHHFVNKKYNTDLKLLMVIHFPWKITLYDHHHLLSTMRYKWKNYIYNTRQILYCNFINRKIKIHSHRRLLSIIEYKWKKLNLKEKFLLKNQILSILEHMKALQFYKSVEILSYVYLNKILI